MTRSLLSILLMLALGLVGCTSSTSPVIVDASGQSTGGRIASIITHPLYLHGAGGYTNPPTLFLDAAAPTDTKAKCKDSPGLHVGDPWAEVGVWKADAAQVRGLVKSLADLRIGAGLISNGDKGKRFDMRAEVYRNYSPGSLEGQVGWGETYDINGLSSSASWAKEVIVAFPQENVITTSFDGTTNYLHLRILTRLAAGGTSNAAGLRVYFDAPSRPSRFGVILNQSPGAVATADPTSGDAPLTVNFSAEGSSDLDGTIIKYEWNFGEGAGFEDVTGTGGVASYTYIYAGTYTATLRVTDNDEAVGTASVTIWAGVVPPQAPDVWPMFGHDPQHTNRAPFVGAQTANVAWKYTIGEPVWSSPAIDANGTLYVGSEDGRLYAINSNGTFKWSCQTGTYVSDSPAIGADGTVYVGSYDHKLYAVNPNGTFKWSFTMGEILWSSPTIGADGTVYVGSSDCKLYAINPDGTEKWSYTTGDRVTSCPAIDVDGTVYVGSCDFKLYAFDPAGSLKWSYPTGGAAGSPAIGVDGTVYVGSGDHKLYAINPDGTKKWSFTTRGVVRSPAIGADGTVYIGSSDKKLYAINSTGSLKWTYTTGNNSTPLTLAIGHDGMLYFGSIDQKLYAINANGTFKWSYTTGKGWASYSSPSIGADGKVYVGSTDGNLYAFGPGGG